LNFEKVDAATSFTDKKLSQKGEGQDTARLLMTLLGQGVNPFHFQHNFTSGMPFA
jgi:hypothetical protein